MSGIFGRRNKNSLKKQDIVGGVRVWSIIYIINFHGTPPTMCRIISSKNKKSTKKQDIVFFDNKTIPLVFTMCRIFSRRNKNSIHKTRHCGWSACLVYYIYD